MKSFASVSKRQNELFMKNKSIIEFNENVDDEQFIGMDKIYFCPECGSPTKDGKILCECGI